MTRFIPFLLVFASCAETTIYDRTTGRQVAKIQGDAENVSFADGSTSFHADSLIHSTPTLAGGKAFSNGVASVGIAAMGIGAATLPGASTLGTVLTRSAVVAVPTTVSATKNAK